LLSGRRVVDETGDRPADVRVVDGLVAEVGPGLAAAAGALVLDAEGCVVAPGLVDIQVHFREPGREEDETIETAPAPPRSAVARRWCACPTPSRRSTTPRSCSRCSNAVASRRATYTSRAVSRRVATANNSRRWGSSTTSACASSPTTATALPTHG
jgi:imidazolonepropionase-like amidohydrolase